ncbi:hypothetical protein QCM8_38 [Bacillus phage QCM8]|nr:hypothetical protein QCM8_38 [Bacillus phage QCM8]
MNVERITLSESLRAEFIRYKDRKTVGIMATEHEIFIPTELIQNAAEETEEFIKVARHIGRQEEWGCPVTAEPKTVMKKPGVEFLFKIQAHTKFDDIIAYISTKI